MCGFVGIISKNNKRFPEETMHAMTSMIEHRGPDDVGHFFHEDWLALGFRRLSILDLSSKGHQPMISQDGRYAIVYNGEVYNYREIRSELVAKGVHFVSGTDTEVILAAYREYGDDCLNKFTGMFAFVIADLQERTAFIARDQLGIKPLFCYEDSNYYFFTSEVKSLLPYNSLEPDFDSFNEYLIFRSVVGENTMFKGVKSLLPGHAMHYKNGTLRSNCYFTLADTLVPNNNISFDDACAEVEDAFSKSVDLHLRSDVELGVQLSGGVDSSLITAIAAKKSNKKLHSFSMSFPDSPECDESEYQKRVADRYGTQHHDYPVTEDNFMDSFSKSIWHYEHPLNDPNGVCTYSLVEKAKKYCTVMLSGEGADESFLGYTKFTEQAVKSVSKRMFLYRHPWLRETLFKLSGKPLFNVTKYDPAMYALSYSDLKIIDPLLKGCDSEMVGRHYASRVAGDNILNKIILQDEICDLGQWFWRADRQGMGASMELRVPFCTPQMFKLANSIPHSLHIRNGERKCILKKIAEKYLDHDQIYRKKVGFGVPIALWMEQDGTYRKEMDSVFTSDLFKNRDFIDKSHFFPLYDAFKKGDFKERNCGFLWTYLNLEKWYRIFFEDGWKQLI